MKEESQNNNLDIINFKNKKYNKLIYKSQLGEFSLSLLDY